MCTYLHLFCLSYFYNSLVCSKPLLSIFLYFVFFWFLFLFLPFFFLCVFGLLVCLFFWLFFFSNHLSICVFICVFIYNILSLFFSFVEKNKNKMKKEKWGMILILFNCVFACYNFKKRRLNSRNC